MIENIIEGNLFLSFILAVLIVFVSATILLRPSVSTIYARRRKNYMPGLQCNTLMTYYIFLKSSYSTKKNIPPLCLLLQYLCGLCKVFDRDRIVRFWVLNRPFVFFFKPETVEVILRSTVNIEKSSEYRFLQPWLGTGLLISKGDKWRVRRKLLTPSFHFRVLDDFIPIFDEQSLVLVSKLKTLAGKSWIDVVPLIKMCTLDIICQTAMGVKMNAQSGGCNDYAKAVEEIGEIFLYRAIRPWLWFDTIFNIFPSGRNFRANLRLVHDFTKKVIKEKKLAMLENYSANKSRENDLNSSPYAAKERRAFLEMLLEYHLSDNSLTEEDIQEEVDTFMFGGHDTTATALIWILYILGLHPNVQEDVIKELDSIFQDDPTRPVTREDLNQMKYLECVIKETLRLYPPVPFIAREVTEDFKVLDYRICTGSLCFIFPLMLHQDPESFPNPEKFEPERFSPENCRNRHPYAFVPFSAGPRNCVGQKFAMMEEKAIIANILRSFRVQSLDQRDKVILTPDLVIRNVDPLRICFTARQ